MKHRLRLSWVVLFAFWPAISFAHAYLVKSIPARRATLLASPAKIQLWFNERLEPRFSTIAVFDSNGKQLGLGSAAVAAADPKQLALAPGILPPGRYVVKFRVLSIDGHAVEDSFPFTIREGK
jgi:methionine-rich copper-binding protein CopC